MKLRDRLFNSFFLRNMLATFGNRTPYFIKTRVFPAYLQYKIGNYQPDFLLYFKKPPTLQGYKNEVFNKMSEYSGVDLAGYPDFHYQASADKPVFTRFLQYEVSETMKWPVSRNSCAQPAVTGPSKASRSTPFRPGSAKLARTLRSMISKSDG